MEEYQRDENSTLVVSNTLLGPITPIPDVLLNEHDPLSSQEAAQDNTSFSEGDETTMPTFTSGTGLEQKYDLPSDSSNIESGYADIADHSFMQMSAAARQIAESEPDVDHNMRRPRFSRLAPLRDISGEIQRESTPLPRTAFSTIHEDSVEDTFDPWLQTADLDEKDEWGQDNDPLQSRRFPTRFEVQRLEEDDIRRAFGEQLSIMLEVVRQKPKQCLRILLVGLVICALIALVIDSVFFAVLTQRTPSFIGASPTLSLSKNTANYGETITIHLRNFTPSGYVALSRNVQESLRLVNGIPLVHVDSNGSKDVTAIVDNTWEAGANTIEAEDVQTRYTASSVVSIGPGSMSSAHLFVQETQIDLGAQIQGANSLHTVILENIGGGEISWTASSSVPWLFVSPTHGLFGDRQDIQVAGDRVDLKPGDYQGKITLSSNAGVPVVIQVHMQVIPIPANAGAVLSVSPPTLSFNAMDGASDPANQTLTVTNPGNKVLNWTLKRAVSGPNAGDNSYLAAVPGAANWLSVQGNSGQVVPGAANTVTIHVHSGNLLPGVYMMTLEFAASAGHTALNSPQQVVISLTVTPRCGVTLSTDMLSFTAVAGQSSPDNQSVSIMTTTGCTDVALWSAGSSVPWMTITPGNGQVRGTAASTATVSINTQGLHPGMYTGMLTFSIAHNTQTVSVVLTVQAPPTPEAPVMSISPLNLNFSMTQGQASPPGQAVTITNSGSSTLNWQIHSSLPWLALANDHSSVAPGQSEQALISVNAGGLAPGTYTGQIAVIGTDHSGNPIGGSPQLLNVSFVVSTPCTLTLPSSSSLAFNVLQGNNSAPQQVAITASGACNWPVTWRVGGMAQSPWLSVSPASGTFTSANQVSNLTLSSSAVGLAAGSYNGSISITASDSTGAVIAGSPQPLSVMATILQPCSLFPAEPSMFLSVSQGQVLNGQSMGLSLTGSCSLPVSWIATSDSNWLQIASPDGSDSGGGSILGLVADATNLASGTYIGTISFTASGSGSAPVVSVPQITVTLTVTGYTVNGVISACSTAIACSGPLSGATVTLVDSSNNVVATQNTASDGSFTFANIANGVYTINVTGVDASLTSYTGTSTVTVNGSSATVNISALSNISTTLSPGTGP